MLRYVGSRARGEQLCVGGQPVCKFRTDTKSDGNDWLEVSIIPIHDNVSYVTIDFMSAPAHIAIPIYINATMDFMSASAHINPDK